MQKLQSYLSAKFLTNPEKLRLTLLIIFVGIFLGRDEWFSEYVLLISGGLLFIAIVIRNFWIGVLAAFLLSFYYGQYRNFADFKNDTLIAHHNQEVEISGTVINFPDFREKSIRVIFQSEKIKNPETNQFKPISGNLLLIVPPDIYLHYGDKLNFTGKLTPPQNFGTFNYQQFLRRFGVQTIARNPNVEIIEIQTSGNFLLRIAEKTRNYFKKNLENSLPPPHSTIAMGILLGVKQELPEFTKNDFKNSTLQHLLVVSGYNVSIVVLLATIILRRFGRKIMFFGSLMAILFFVAMTGAEAPVVRAAVMGGIVGYAAASGRFSDARNVFFLAITIIALFDPKIVQSDIGFYLSSVATLGIIVGTPIMEKILSFIPNRWELRTVLAVTIVAQLSVSPVLGLSFGEFPIAGFFSNILAEPLVSIGMAFSFLSAVVGFLPQVFAKIIAIPTFLVLELLLWIAHLFSIFKPFYITEFISKLLGISIFVIFFGLSFSRPAK